MRAHNGATCMTLFFLSLDHKSTIGQSQVIGFINKSTDGIIPRLCNSIQRRNVRYIVITSQLFPCKQSSKDETW